MLSACGGAKLSVADEQMARGEYFDASKTYRKVYNKLTKREDRPLRGEVAFKMANAYRMLRQTARAAGAYQNAINFGWQDSTAYLYLGECQQAEGRYQQAIESYRAYLDKVPGDKRALTGIAGCRQFMDKSQKSRYVVRRHPLFNSSRSDFAPMYFDKAFDRLYYSSTNEKVTGNRRSEITGMKKADIYVSAKNEKGQWGKPEPVEGELNSEFDEGIISFTPDGQTMYLTKARRELNANTGVEIFTSTRSDAKWSAPVKY